jgi:D-amino-acid dehydrogenase
MKDVTIIGGGIIGLCCAYYLQQAGFSIIVIDEDASPKGCSYGNAGMIVPSHFTPLASPGMISKGFQWMLNKHSPFYIKPRLSFDLLQWLWTFYRVAGKDHVVASAPLLRDLHWEGRDFFLNLTRQPGFDFRFEQRGILMLYKTAEAEKEELENAEKAESLHIQANVLTRSQIEQLDPAAKINVRGGVHYPGDAHFNPELMMSQLSQHLLSSGVEFIRGRAIDIRDDKHRSMISLSSGETLSSLKSIVCCGMQSAALLKQLKFPILLQDGKGYSMMYSNKPERPAVPSILIEPRVAITPMGDLIRVAGTFEMSGMDNKIKQHKVNSILRAVTSFYPDWHPGTGSPVWFGYRPCTPDGLPYIGWMKPGSSVLLATGHAMMGMSLAPATGRIIRDLMTDKILPASFSKLSPSRF